jgi:ferredoxin
MAMVNPGFAKEIVKYGAKDFSACYNCGTCTAICNLTEENVSFPRVLIRKGMLGLTDDITSAKEIWLCYACGDCSVSCPRQAAPGDYMSALRRYAIASYEPTGLSKLILKNNAFSILITLALAILLGFFLGTIRPETEIARWIFSILPYEVIHNVGIGIFAFTGLSIVWGLVAMSVKLSGNVDKEKKNKKSILMTLKEVAQELATMKRYQDCDLEENAFWNARPFFLRPWVVHWSIMWGFIGLLLATILDFLFKDPATDMWLPTRILGTLSGIFLIYGTTAAIIYRLKKITRAYRDTRLADWMFLIFLWLAGFTGFWLEVAVFFSASGLTNQVVFMIHTIISMELVLLFAFSKFAHALYRPVALYFRSRT